MNSPFPLNSRANLYLGRRQVFQLAAAAAVVPLLSRCTSAPTGTSATSGVNKGTGFVAPTYLPREALPGSTISKIEGVLPAYTQFPRPAAKSVAKTPGSGSTVTTFQVLFRSPPPADNPWLTEFNKRLGVQLSQNLAASASYSEKLQTVIASGNIPDLIFLASTAAPGVAQALQQGAFTDLTSVLSGSGIDPYPNLARISTPAWQNSTVKGKLYGIPREVPTVNSGALYRRDWAQDLGHPDPPKNAAEFKDLLAGFTKGNHRGRAKGDTWGIGQLSEGVTAANQMFRVPNKWRLNKDGTLTSEIETDEFEAATAWLVELWKAGAFHPDAASLPALQGESMFKSGQLGFLVASLIPLYGVMRSGLQGSDAKADAASLIPPGHDGGKPVTYRGPGFAGVTAIPAKVGKDAARLAELLRVLDYWCAPFGSEEFLFVNYGIEGRHFTLDATGSPMAIKGDVADTEVIGTNYLSQPSEAQLFFPGKQDQAAAVQEAMAAALPISVTNPTLNKVSAAQSKQSAALTQINTDFQFGIITGRRPLTDLKAWREKWRQSGGDTIRKEYEAAL